MTSVLYTEETPFCVFVREVDMPIPESCLNRFSTFIQAGAPAARVITYHPRPGSASAIGCWSLLSDAGWRKTNGREYK